MKSHSLPDAGRSPLGGAIRVTRNWQSPLQSAPVLGELPRRRLPQVNEGRMWRC